MYCTIFQGQAKKNRNHAGVGKLIRANHRKYYASVDNSLLLTLLILDQQKGGNMHFVIIVISTCHRQHHAQPLD